MSSSRRLTAVLLGAALALSGGACAEAVTLNDIFNGGKDFGTFPLDNARILTRSGENTTIVELRGFRDHADPTARMTDAARTWCGGDAYATQVSPDTNTIQAHRTYLVKCR